MSENKDDTILFDKFALDKTLGKGAFAKVYLARNLKTGENIAIKVVTDRDTQQIQTEDFVFWSLIVRNDGIEMQFQWQRKLLKDTAPVHSVKLDFEFLGTIPGKPYTLHTNIYGNGSGDGNITSRIRREQRFHLWFDPTQDFHNYTILWTPHHIMFFMDNIPIRQFRKVKSVKKQFPTKPMSIYATVWDRSEWATDGGKHRANYSYEPFLSTYTHFIISGCTVGEPDCKPGRLDHLFQLVLNLYGWKLTWDSCTTMVMAVRIPEAFSSLSQEGAYVNADKIHSSQPNRSHFYCYHGRRNIPHAETA